VTIGFARERDFYIFSISLSPKKVTIGFGTAPLSRKKVTIGFGTAPLSAGNLFADQIQMSQFLTHRISAPIQL